MIRAISVSALAYGNGSYDIYADSTTDDMDGFPGTNHRNTSFNWSILIACGNVTFSHRLVALRCRAAYGHGYRNHVPWPLETKMIGAPRAYIYVCQMCDGPLQEYVTFLMERKY